jgi:hypothetical protein
MKKFLLFALLFAGIYWYLIGKAGAGYNTYVPGDYHSTLHADAAGYNVYLPAISPYAFKGKFPDGADQQCGYGFTLDKDRKVITKYNYGVALMQSPFYFAGMAYAKLTHKEFTGFGAFNHKLVDYAGIFYGLLGLFLLFFFIKEYFNSWVSLASVLILFSAFNVLWYVVVQPGMSHVYSFFLFSLYLLTGQQYYKKQNFFLLLLICFAASYIVLIRPVNLIFLPVLFFLPQTGYSTLKDRFFVFFTLKNVITAGFCAVLVVIPQVIYWKFAYGEYLPDTYPNESFSNLWSPQLMELFMAAKSGVIAYNPIYLLIIPVVIVLAVKQKEPYYKAILIIFAILSYTCAAWYEYFFGCGFGNRNFMEYSGLLLLPLAFTLQYLSRKKILLAGFLLAVIGCIAVNVKLTESFDMCFFGKDIWDYHEYKYLLLNHYEKKEITFEDSLSCFDRIERIKDPITNTNTLSRIRPEVEFASVIRIPVNEIGYVVPRKIEFSVEINPIKENFSSEVVVQVMRNKEQIFFQALPFSTVDPLLEEYNFYSPLPADLQKTDEVLIFFWNRGKKLFYADNYRLRFR